MAKTCNDARLWASMSMELRRSGLEGNAQSEWLARKMVALVRRERATNGARTWAPGETIPMDVVTVYDLDGYIWQRVWSGPSALDRWEMQGFNDEKHDSRCGELHSTDELLVEWGPVTEWMATRG